MGIPEVRSQSSLGGGENIRRDKEKVVESGELGEREFTSQPERNERGEMRGLEGRSQRDGGERAGHIEGEHWPGALLRAAPSPSFLQET